MTYRNLLVWLRFLLDGTGRECAWRRCNPENHWATEGAGSPPTQWTLFMHRYQNRPIGQVNLELFTTMTRDAWISQELAIAKQGGAAMHISIRAMPSTEETAKLAEEIQSTGMADLLELNVSCPMPASTVGMHIGKSAELTYA